jgi:hypothetical protein
MPSRQWRGPPTRRDLVLCLDVASKASWVGQWPDQRSTGLESHRVGEAACLAVSFSSRAEEHVSVAHVTRLLFRKG